MKYALDAHIAYNAKFYVKDGVLVGIGIYSVCCYIQTEDQTGYFLFYIDVPIVSVHKSKALLNRKQLNIDKYTDENHLDENVITHTHTHILMQLIKA